MRGRFFIFVVFAIALQNSLTIQTTTSTRIQSKMMADHSKTEILGKVAKLECQRMVDIIFDFFVDLASVACGDQHPAEGSLTSTNESKIEATAALMSQITASYLAIGTSHPRVFSTSSSTQTIALAQVQLIFHNIFDGIGPALSKNSLEWLAYMETCENETLTALLNLNEMMFGTFRNGQDTPRKIEKAIAKAEKQAAVQLGNVTRQIYVAIEAVRVAVTSGNQSECGTFFCVIENAKNQVSISFNAVLDITLRLNYNFLVSFFIIQSGIQTDFSVIEAIKTAAASDYETAMNTQHCSTKVTHVNENGMLADSAAIEDAKTNALFQVRLGVTLIYTTINIAYAELADGNHYVSKDDDLVSKITLRKELDAFKSVIDYYFNTTDMVKPKPSSIDTEVRQATYVALQKVYVGVQSGIDLKNCGNSNEISARIDSIENTTITEAVLVTENVFIVILNAQESGPESETAIDHLRKQTISLIKKIFQTIFIAIRILLAQAFPEYRLEGENCFSSIEAAQIETYSLFSAVVETVFIAIQTLFLSVNSFENQSGLGKYSCSCASAYQ